MGYFLLEKNLLTKNSLLIKTRLHRKFNFTPILKISTGDIITLVFWREAIVYKFEGICIALKKKSLDHINVTICVRNIIDQIGIEITAAFFPNRIYALTVSDYKRKQLLYRKAKLYYLRTKLNRASRVK